MDASLIKRYAGDDWLFRLRSTTDQNQPNDLTGILPGGEIIDPTNNDTLYIADNDVEILNQSDPQTRGRYILRVPRIKTDLYLPRSLNQQNPNALYNAKRVLKLRTFLEITGNRQTQEVILFTCIRA